MDSLMNVSPGLFIWSLINFVVLLFILKKFAFPAILNSIKAREESIKNNIETAEKASLDAQRILKETQDKLANAQQEMSQIVAKGREQAQSLLSKAGEESDRVKQQKMEEAKKEIEASKDRAIAEIRKEMAGLIIEATEKILSEKLDKGQHQQLIEKYIQKLPTN